MITHAILLSFTKGFTIKKDEDFQKDIEDRGFNIKAEDIPKRHGNAVCIVRVGGEETVVFNYYNDELAFSESQFIGKTLEQARDIRHRTDVAYLRS